MKMEEIEIGKNYKIVHSRKGEFSVTVTHDGDDFITGKIIEGYADAIHSNNIRTEGESITFRKSLCEITPL